MSEEIPPRETSSVHISWWRGKNVICTYRVHVIHFSGCVESIYHIGDRLWAHSWGKDHLNVLILSAHLFTLHGGLLGILLSVTRTEFRLGNKVKIIYALSATRMCDMKYKVSSYTSRHWQGGYTLLPKSILYRLAW